jgi:hypothetical protein
VSCRSWLTNGSAQSKSFKSKYEAAKEHCSKSFPDLPWLFVFVTARTLTASDSKYFEETSNSLLVTRWHFPDFFTVRHHLAHQYCGQVDLSIDDQGILDLLPKIGAAGVKKIQASRVDGKFTKDSLKKLETSVQNAVKKAMEDGLAVFDWLQPEEVDLSRSDSLTLQTLYGIGPARAAEIKVARIDGAFTSRSLENLQEITRQWVIQALDEGKAVFDLFEG